MKMEVDEEDLVSDYADLEEEVAKSESEAPTEKTDAINY